MDETPTPQPVIKNAAATGIPLIVLTQIAGFTAYMGWWTPSAEDIAQFAGLVGTLVGVALLVQGWFVHKRVTPNQNVALTVADAKVLDPAGTANVFEQTRFNTGADAPLPPPNR